MNPELVQRALHVWGVDQERRALVHERTALLSELDGLEREQFTLTLSARQERAEADALERITIENLWLLLTGELGAMREREGAEADAAFARTMELGARIGQRDARVREVDQLLVEMGDTWAPVVAAMADLERVAGDLPGPRAAVEAARRLEAVDHARFRLAVALRALGSWAFALLCGTSGATDPELLAVAALAPKRAEEAADALDRVDEAFAAIDSEDTDAYGARLRAVNGLRGRAPGARRMLELLPILARDLRSHDPGLIERAARAAAEADLETALAGHAG